MSKQNVPPSSKTMAATSIGPSTTTTTTTTSSTSTTLQPMGDILGDQVSQTKLLSALILFVVTLLCGYLPVRILLNQTYIQYAMFAGGGVLMATVFCHLIPETHDSYKLATSNQHDDHHHHHQPVASETNTTAVANFTLEAASNATLLDTATITEASDSHDIPYLEITLCCGFFFMYLVEQLMVRFINNHSHEHPCDSSLSAGQMIISAGGDSQSCQDEGLPANGGSSTCSSSTGLGNLNHANNLVENSITTTNNNKLSSTTVFTGAGSSSLVLTCRSRQGGHLYKFIRGLLIVSAFLLHSIFDGVAIGSQQSIEKVWTIFAAISCHKLIIAAVVGLELFGATLESHLWTLVHLSLFSIMSPIGIIMVVIAQNSLHIDSKHLAMILLQSFATGTLLYIVFIEILQPKEDQAYERNRFGKSLSLIAGFVLMLTVLTLIGH